MRDKSRLSRKVKKKLKKAFGKDAFCAWRKNSLYNTIPGFVEEWDYVGNVIKRELFATQLCWNETLVVIINHMSARLRQRCLLRYGIKHPGASFMVVSKEALEIVMGMQYFNVKIVDGVEVMQLGVKYIIILDKRLKSSICICNTDRKISGRIDIINYKR